MVSSLTNVKLSGEASSVGSAALKSVPDPRDKADVRIIVKKGNPIKNLSITKDAELWRDHKGNKLRGNTG